MSEKTYVFDNGDGGCGGNNGMMGLIASLCQNRGLDPNLVTALMSNRSGNGFGDGNGSWIWVIFLFFLMGWNRNGFGGFGGNGQGEGNFLAGQLANDTGRDLLMSAIQGNGTAISQLASTLNCDINAVQGSLNQLQQSICNVGNQVGMSSQAIINAINQGNCQIATQISSCCCDIRQQVADFRGDISLQMCQQTNSITNGQNFINRSIERGFADVGYTLRDQTCSIEKSIADSTSQILAGQRAAEMREMQRELQTLRDEKLRSDVAAMIQANGQNVINTVRPCPTPAFLTCNPWGCNGGYYGNGYTYGGNGCCGNNNNCGGCCNG